MTPGLRSRPKGYPSTNRRASGSQSDGGLRSTVLFHKMVAIDPKWSIESNQQGQVSIKNYNAALRPRKGRFLREKGGKA
jgi:hypothetical protein